MLKKWVEPSESEQRSVMVNQDGFFIDEVITLWDLKIAFEKYSMLAVRERWSAYIKSTGREPIVYYGVIKKA